MLPSFKTTLANRLVPGGRLLVGKILNGLLDSAPSRATFEVAPEVADNRDVTITLTDADGNALKGDVVVTYFVTPTATGAIAPGNALSDILVQNGVLLDEPIADVSGRVAVSGGVFKLRLNKTGATTTYLRVICGACIHTSSAITFAA